VAATTAPRNRALPPSACSTFGAMRRLVLIFCIAAVSAILALTAPLRNSGRRQPVNTAPPIPLSETSPSPALAGTQAPATLVLRVCTGPDGDRPVPDARCTVTGRAPGLLSDRDGRAVLTGLSIGESLALHIAADGYDPLQLTACVERPLTLLEARLVGNGALHGTVTAAGSPVDGASVILRIGPERRSTRTDKSGAFAIAGLPERSNAELDVFKRGFRRYMAPVDTVATSAVTVDLQSTPLLSTILHFGDAEHLPAHEAEWPATALVCCGDHVVFSGPLVISGNKALLRTEYKPGLTVRGVIQLSSASQELEAAGRVEAVGDSYRAHLHFPTVDMAQLRVVNRDRVLQPNTPICLALSPRAFVALRTNEDGCVAIPVAVGSEAIMLWNTDGIAGPIATPEAGEIATVVLGEDACVLDIRGLGVAGADGEPTPSGIAVEGIDLGSPPFPCRPYDGGVLYFVPPGTYRVLWRGAPLTAFDAVLRSIGDRLVVTLGDLASQTSIHGTGPPNATIEIWSVVDGRHRQLGRTQVGSDGTFRFSGLPGGKYVIQVRHQGAGLSRSVDVIKGGATDAGDLSPASARRLVFAIRDAKGHALARSRVGVQAAPTVNHVRSAYVTDDDGMFEASMEDSAQYVITIGSQFCLADVAANDHTVELTVPEVSGPCIFRVPPGLLTSQLLWVDVTRPRVAWVSRLVEADRGTYHFPHVTGRHYFMIATASGSEVFAGMLQGDTVALEPRTTYTDFPEDAQSYTYKCVQLAERDLSSFSWHIGPKAVPPGGVSLSVPSGARFTVTLYGPKRVHTWKAIIDGDSDTIRFLR